MRRHGMRKVRAKRRRVRRARLAPLVRGSIGLCYCCGKKSFLRRASYHKTQGELSSTWYNTKALVKNVADRILQFRAFLPTNKAACSRCASHEKSVVFIGLTMDTVEGPFCVKCAREKAKRFEDEFGIASYEAFELNVAQRFGTVERMYEIFLGIQKAMYGAVSSVVPVAPVSDPGLLF